MRMSETLAYSSRLLLAETSDDRVQSEDAWSSTVSNYTVTISCSDVPNPCICDAVYRTQMKSKRWIQCKAMANPARNSHIVFSNRFDVPRTYAQTAVLHDGRFAVFHHFQAEEDGCTGAVSVINAEGEVSRTPIPHFSDMDTTGGHVSQTAIFPWQHGVGLLRPSGVGFVDPESQSLNYRKIQNPFPDKGMTENAFPLRAAAEPEGDRICAIINRRTTVPRVFGNDISGTRLAVLGPNKDGARWETCTYMLKHAAPWDQLAVGEQVHFMDERLVADDRSHPFEYLHLGDVCYCGDQLLLYCMPPGDTSFFQSYKQNECCYILSADLQTGTATVLAECEKGYGRFSPDGNFLVNRVRQSKPALRVYDLSEMPQLSPCELNLTPKKWLGEVRKDFGHFGTDGAHVWLACGAQEAVTCCSLASTAESYTPVDPFAGKTTDRIKAFTKAAADGIYPDHRGYYSGDPAAALSENFAEAKRAGFANRLGYLLESAGHNYERRGIFARVVRGDFAAQNRGHNTCSRLKLLSTMLTHGAYPHADSYLFDMFSVGDVCRALITGDQAQLAARQAYVQRCGGLPDNQEYYGPNALYYLLRGDGGVDGLVPHIESLLPKLIKYDVGLGEALIGCINGDADRLSAGLEKVLASSSRLLDGFTGTAQYIAIPAQGLHRLFGTLHPQVELAPPEHKLWDAELDNYNQLSPDGTAVEDLKEVSPRLDEWVRNLPVASGVPDLGFEVRV